MAKIDYYLKVERNNKQETVSIIGNKKGLEYLKKCIDSLLKYEGSSFPQDISLMYPSWGGQGLSEEEDAPTSPNFTRIEHLRLYRWE
jgi:hypothetical protein